MPDPTTDAGLPTAEGPAPKPGRRFAFTLIELIIVICIIGVLAAISTPKYSAARQRAHTRACYSNQKTLLGAVEMYNLDRKANERTLSPALVETLKSGGYIRQVPDDPGEGPTTFGHYSLAGTQMQCSVHGAIQDVAPAAPVPLRSPAAPRPSPR